MSEQYEVTPIIIDTADKTEPDAGSDLWKNREMIYESLEDTSRPLVSIYVQAYNRLEKTRYCVECVLKYTNEIDYELILVDNGSSDGTYEYFQKVPWKNKQIIRVSKNIGMTFPWYTIRQIYRGKYLAGIPNDVYVTKNWLKNLLRCLESDSRIGFVNPVSCNVSNLQEVVLPFGTLDEMQEQAAVFNCSDPSKWEERLRLIALLCIYKREVLDLVGIPDCGFAHSFNEDDYAARLRHVGYRLMLCKDTYVHHDHNYRESDIIKFKQDCAIGKQNFKEKYYLDGWYDFDNFEPILMNMLVPESFTPGVVHALSVDVRCGTPVLDIRNKFKAAKTGHKILSYAFTTQAKYYDSLLRQAENVVCDRIEFIGENYKEESMDLILLGEPLNDYGQPLVLLRKLILILKKGGVLLVKRRNLNSYLMLLQNLKLDGADTGVPYTYLSEKEFVKCLENLDVSDLNSTAELYRMTDEKVNLIKNIAKMLNPNNCDETTLQLMTNNYHCCIVK